jgi:hypothetical protein
MANEAPAGRILKAAIDVASVAKTAQDRFLPFKLTRAMAGIRTQSLPQLEQNRLANIFDRSFLIDCGESANREIQHWKSQALLQSLRNFLNDFYNHCSICFWQCLKDLGN